MDLGTKQNATTMATDSDYTDNDAAKQSTSASFTTMVCKREEINVFLLLRVFFLILFFFFF
jgi:hypothetical protein